MKNQMIFDHIYVGASLKTFIYPPRIPADVEDFSNALQEVIPEKLNYLLLRCEQLKRQKDELLTLIANHTKVDSIGRYFWSSFTFHEFSEYYVIQKWLDYWLLLWRKIHGQGQTVDFSRFKNHIDDTIIAQAKLEPIEHHYDGRLRKVGTRFVGLCPFHEERTPSFTIYTKDNTYHCFGCSAHGDVISFIQKTKELDFLETVRYLHG